MRSHDLKKDSLIKQQKTHFYKQQQNCFRTNPWFDERKKKQILFSTNRLKILKAQAYKIISEPYISVGLDEIHCQHLPQSILSTLTPSWSQEVFALERGNNHAHTCTRYKSYRLIALTSYLHKPMERMVNCHLVPISSVVLDMGEKKWITS